jgi:hypothetical protein
VSDWSDQAQCREAGVEMFFPWKGSGQPVYAHHVADAVAVCAALVLEVVRPGDSASDWYLGTDPIEVEW